MDILKTLLIYMSATLAAAVQVTSAPEVTPVPTPAPTIAAIVETVTEVPSAAPVTTAAEEATATPEPTVSVTPAPVPSITPNKGYRNLAQGAKGTEVRKLQERLIELGYLPEGAADGAYGNQTRNAVRRFQYYNGLTQDGVAGDTTQTYLFENPDAAPYPTETPAAPEAEATPAAEETETAETETAAETKAAEPTDVPVIETPAAEKEVPETEAPETEAPVTEVPETEAPVTEAPETEAPETEAPETEAPATEAPTTKAPETEAPATEAPVTEAPETEAPVTKAPVTEAPTTKAPETEAPATEAPVTEAPVTEAPETEAPATEAPVTETPAVTTEIVEEVDLDEGAFEAIDGSVVLGDSGSELEWVEMEDGVPVAKRPRLEERQGRVRVSLEDLIRAIDGWRLTRAEDTVVIEAAGYVVGLYNEDSGLSATVDGLEVEMDPEDFAFDREGDFIDAEFLARCLGGEAEWDAEESTLMLRIPGKEVSTASD